MAVDRYAYARETQAAHNTEGYNNVVDIFDRAVEEYADRTAFNAIGQNLSFAEVESYSRAFAAQLLDGGFGLSPGDRVAVQLPNLLQYPIAAYGVLRAGLILVNTNPLYTAKELSHQLSDSGAKLLVTLAEFMPVAESVIEQTQVETVVVTNVFDMLEAQPAPENQLPNHVQLLTFPEVLAAGEGKQLPALSVSMDDVAVLQYTGGTTGVSKGAMLTHGNVFGYTVQAKALQDMDPRYSEDEPEILIAPLPLYHVFGFTLYLMGTFFAGGMSVLIPNPRDLDSMMDTMTKHRFTGFAAVNTMLVGMLQNPKFEAIDWSANKGTIAGGAALVPEVAKEWEQRTGTKVFEGYGLSETCATVAVNSSNDCRLGSVGKAMIAQEIEIRDAEGNPCAAGEEGELCVRGVQVMKGYWGRPEATEEAIDEHGFFRTGDVAVMEDDGFIRIVDRLKDMILVSGFNVYPNEIEAVVYEHPDVVECAVVGKPDEKTGESVCLYAVSSRPSLTEAELRDYCREHLTGYKIPKQVVFLDELPKTNVGKILRRELR